VFLESIGVFLGFTGVKGMLRGAREWCVCVCYILCGVCFSAFCFVGLR
jgi:hypothetical protein